MTDTPTPAPLVLLEVDVTTSDIEAFNMHVGCGPTMRARWRRQHIMLAATTAAIVVVWNWLDAGIAGFSWYAHVLVPVAAIVILFAAVSPLNLAMHRWSLRRGLRAQLRRSPGETYLGPQRIEVTAEGIAVTGSVSRGVYGWAAVSGLQETPALILVMLGETMAVVVPKRGQADAALEALRAAVRKHAGDAATRL
jgi:hypothetical protein